MVHIHSLCSSSWVGDKTVSICTAKHVCKAVCQTLQVTTLLMQTGSRALSAGKWLGRDNGAVERCDNFTPTGCQSFSSLAPLKTQGWGILAHTQQIEKHHVVWNSVREKCAHICFSQIAPRMWEKMSFNFPQSSLSVMTWIVL